MTRFARVKGLGSERKAEEATSWQDMRKGIELNQSNEKKPNSSDKPNWKQKIARDTAEEINVNSEWTAFSNDLNVKSKKSKSKHKKFENVSDSNTDVKLPTETVDELKNKSSKVKKLKKKNIDPITDEVTVKKRNKKDKPQKEEQIEKGTQVKTKIDFHDKEHVVKKKQNKNTSSKFNNHNPEYPEYKRRKPDSGNYTECINGKTIDIVRYEGFFIKKEDAINLRKLKKKFLNKGVPHNELQAIMKLERRKAEKSLAREKKRVCFHCRKSGHNLSECPELPSNGSAASGICFKCGSTEHTYFQCKVSQGEDFRFAQCFICKEEGHIAKQCPDNPRGLYPKGGACRICGDVTHMKKDCPESQEKTEQINVTAETFSGQSLDILDEELRTENKQKRPLNKKIKFF